MNTTDKHLRKNVLISGASSGIGAATARRFSAEGWNVCLNARRESLLKDLVRELSEGDHLICPGDYSDPDVVQEIAKSIGRKWHQLDALVNSAGISREHDAINSPIEQWRVCLDTMIYGAVNLTRIAVPLMVQGGRIIHVTSVHGQFAWSGSSSYGMAKAAISHKTK